MGLNSGSVVVGSIGDNLRMDYTAIGDTTNVAARIQGFASPGSIVCSEAVIHAAREQIEAISLGPQTLKGKAEAVTLYEVVRAHERVFEPSACLDVNGRALGLVARQRGRHAAMQRQADHAAV